MRAISSRGRLALETLDLPEPQAGQSRIRILRAGICRTDFELIRGYKQFSGVLGHEFVGVAETGPYAGQRVVAEINIACHSCDLCQRNLHTHCRHRRIIGMLNWQGAFADSLVVPNENIQIVPDAITDNAAVFIEPLAAAAQILEMHFIRPSDRVLVIGAGKLGLLVAQVARLTGAAVRVVARRERARQLLARWGIPIVDAEQLSPSSFDVVIDATGNREGFATGIEAVRPRGTIILKSTYTSTPIIDMSSLVIKEVYVVGSRCGPFDAAIRLLAADQIDVISMIDGVYDLDAYEQAFKHAAQPGTLKILLTT
jgi:2-desacetyl-2-hydroxyethyl bacteriochlorophyllide A dehydrogenase